MGSVLVDIGIKSGLVELSVSGQAPIMAQPDFGEETLQRLRTLRSEGTPDEYGWELLQAVFRDDVAEGLHDVWSQTRSSRDRWRIRLHIDPAADNLLPLWWECLYDRGMPQRFAQTRMAPLSRYIDRKGRPAVTAEKLRVLVAVANPVDLESHSSKWPGMSRLEEDAEIRLITDALRKLGDRVEYKILTEPAGVGQISEMLYAGPKGDQQGFHVLHVVGHAGVDEGGVPQILLERDDETLDEVSQGDFVQSVADLPELRLVVLAGTFTGRGSNGEAFLRTAAAMVQAGVPAAVAMQDQVTEIVSQTFAEKFYTSFGGSAQLGGMVDAAITEARYSIAWSVRNRREESWAWSIPVLFMRGDGELFASTEAPESSRAGTSSGGLAGLSQIPTDESRGGGGTEAGGGKSGAGSGSSSDPSREQLTQLLAQAVRDLARRGGTNVNIEHLDAQAASLGSTEWGGVQMEQKNQSGGINVGDVSGTIGDVTGGDKVTAGGDAVTGDQAHIDKSVSVTFDRGEFASELDRVINILRAAQVSGPEAEQAIGQLEQAKTEAAAGAPQETVKSRLESAAEVLDKSGEVVKKGLSLGSLLMKAAKLVGAVLTFL